MTRLLSITRPNSQALPYLLIFFLALGLRLWQLDARVFHYDESIHAFYSWQLYTGAGYDHNPLMHGPFKFLATAFIFLLGGDTEFTARLLPALMGSLAVGIIYFLRQELGRIGGILTALLLAISPSMLYFSRLARDDILMVVWALLLLICLLKYIEQPRAKYLYFAAIAFSLSFATMETSYIFAVILLSFLFFRSAPELWQALKKRSLVSLSPPASFFLFLFSLSLPLYSPGLGLFQDPLGIVLANPDDKVAPVGAPLGIGLGVAVVIFTFFFIISVALGLSWQRRPWLIGAGLFYGLYITLYSTFFTNLQGIGTGAWGSVGYWIVQHFKGRIQQPLFYYPYLLSVYEFLPLLLSIVTALFLWRKRRLFSLFLIYWAVMSLALYSYAGEKVPWLMLNINLPLILLAGMGVSEVFRRKGSWGKGILITFLLAALPFTLKVSLQANYPDPQPKVEMLVYAQGGDEMNDIKEQLAPLLAAGKRLSIDSARSWPWQWYFRGNPQVDFPDLSSPPTTPPRGDVLLIDSQHETNITQYLQRYGEKRDFLQLIWFPERYKEQGVATVGRGWPHYFLFRQAEAYWNWSTTIYFPRL